MSVAREGEGATNNDTWLLYAVVGPPVPTNCTWPRLTIGVPGGAAALVMAAPKATVALAIRTKNRTARRVIDGRAETARAEQLFAAPPCRGGVMTVRCGAVPLSSRGRAAAAAPMTIN